MIEISKRHAVAEKKRSKQLILLRKRFERNHLGYDCFNGFECNGHLHLIGNGKRQGDALKLGTYNLGENI
jgi:hypothetical protein